MYAILLTAIMAVIIYFFILYTIESFINLKYRIYEYTPPPVPMYYRHCPPPPPQYYLRLELLESQPDADEDYLAVRNVRPQLK
jgi:hypothetical protein